MARVKVRRDQPVDERDELLGPFRRPVRSDWAFWLFCVAMAVDLAIRASHSWSSSGSTPRFDAGFLLGMPFDAFGILMLFSLVIGVPRGFLLGWRGGAPPATEPKPPSTVTEPGPPQPHSFSTSH